MGKNKKMSTPSKPQRFIWSRPTRDEETKDIARQQQQDFVREEKKDVDNFASHSLPFQFSSSFFPLQSTLPSFPTLSPSPFSVATVVAVDLPNWFCTDNALAKRVCMQRSPQDVTNWTTEFRGGLEGGMSEDECKRSCGREPSTSSSSSLAAMAPESKIVNTGFLTGMIASMLTPQEVVGLMQTNRLNLSQNDSIQQERLALDTELSALANVSGTLFTNPKYHLNKILNILRKQESSVHKSISYPLLINYLPRIYHSAIQAFLTLFMQLPKFEKFKVLVKVGRNTFNGSAKPAVMQELINQGIFELDDDEIPQNILKNRLLWEMRDEIFSGFGIQALYNWSSSGEQEETFRRLAQIVDWFLDLRQKEEMQVGAPILTPALSEWFNALSANVVNLNNRPRTQTEITRKWLHTFLERGYYSIENQNERPVWINPGPLISAIVLNDPVLISKIAKEFATETGLLIINTEMKQLAQFIGEARDEDKPKSQIIYDSLKAIFDALITKVPLSAPALAIFFPPPPSLNPFGGVE